MKLRNLTIGIGIGLISLASNCLSLDKIENKLIEITYPHNLSYMDKGNCEGYISDSELKMLERYKWINITHKF